MRFLTQPMSAIGTKRTCEAHRLMSAFGGKADIGKPSNAMFASRNLSVKRLSHYAARPRKQYPCEPGDTFLPPSAMATANSAELDSCLIAF